MREEIRRPAGVDPSVLKRDELEADAEAIGRRVAWKLFPFGAHAAEDTGNRKRWDAIADVVEAEIRSASGTPEVGVVVLRFSYAEAVQAVTAIVEAAAEPERSASEAETLSELREKFFLALGISVSCRMDAPNARSS